MRADITELLREGIDRATTGASVPAGLVAAAQRQHEIRQVRFRRVTMSTAVAGSAATVMAVAVIAASGPGVISTATRQRHPGRLPVIQTVAYVKHRVENALAEISAGRAIEVVRSVGHDATFGFPGMDRLPVIKHPALTVPRTTFWYYNGLLRQEGFTASGTLVFDANAKTGPPGGRFQITSGVGVDYQARTWWRTVIKVQNGVTYPIHLPRCSLVSLPPPVAGPQNWPAEIHTALACGLYTVRVQRQGQRVRSIELVSTRPQRGPLAVSQKIWIDPATYRPQKVEWTWPGPGRASRPGSLTGVFSWLRPIKENLALLDVAIPAGFRQVSSAGLPFPSINQQGGSR